MIAMFLPNSNVTKLVTMFVNSSQCDEFRKSGVFDPKERSKVRPDRRTRPSYKFRDKELWKEWKEFYTRVTDYICLAVTLMKTQLSIEPTSERFKSRFTRLPQRLRRRGMSLWHCSSRRTTTSPCQ
ncbi:hypothetical protein FOWG_14768 [Fusarium oxysporum f. sp. lycopersici MN25]|uniref:Uncharacterized protein n=1 Tax=Fusarium oxysporum Fo47 TaxID=660027 RepID=W9K360_FUSOX|nr:hypothetical protein FOZG_10268 [Fusarium oxysporum Fo47]EWZ81196.1 hypothetical protein FOWG_14768 [Fusarium oxysporum f. sp. lycopersici MN25]